MYSKDILLEWIILPHKQSKSYVEKISELILKEKLRLYQIAETDPAEIVVPFTNDEIEKLKMNLGKERAVIFWVRSQQISQKQKKSIYKRTNSILPHIVWETPLSQESLHSKLMQIYQEKQVTNQKI